MDLKSPFMFHASMEDCSAVLSFFSQNLITETL